MCSGSTGAAKSSWSKRRRDMCGPGTSSGPQATFSTRACTTSRAASCACTRRCSPATPSWTGTISSSSAATKAAWTSPATWPSEAGGCASSTGGVPGRPRAPIPASRFPLSRSSAHDAPRTRSMWSSFPTLQSPLWLPPTPDSRSPRTTDCSFTRPCRPSSQVGFAGSHPLVMDHFESREDGFPLLNRHDESTIVPGIYLCGAAVRHDKHIFCFIYKYPATVRGRREGDRDLAGPARRGA